ncbi:Gfo/Idh/MocA family protein [Rathayibacter sp. CAU 1779]
MNPTHSHTIVMVGLHFGRTVVQYQLRASSISAYFTLKGVCDLDQDLAADAAAEFGVRHYKDLDEVLADPEVEVVGLFTGPVGRAELVRQVVRAGKHVMTTKPFEIDAHAAESVLLEAEEYGRYVFLNSPEPRTPADQAMIEAWQRVHNLGAVIAARAEVWASYHEVPDGSWYDDPELCPVAPILRLGIYSINDMINVLGTPETVNVIENRFRTERPTTDIAQATIRFENGSIGAVFASFCIDDGHPYGNDLVLNFERGTIRRRVVEERPDGTRVIRVSIDAVEDRGSPISGSVDFHERTGTYDWEWLCRCIDGDSHADVALLRRRVVAGVRVIAALGRSAKVASSVPVEAGVTTPW